MTPRLVIRPWQRSDLDAYQGWPPFTDPLFAGFNPEARSTLELDLEWIAAQLNPGHHCWTIVAQGDVIGRITLHETPGSQGAGQLGMLLGAPYVGQGFGTEALQGWLDAYFGKEEMQSVTLHVACWNRRARRLYDRMGFTEVCHYWQTAGLAGNFSFLQGPEYVSLDTCFRWAQGNVYALWAEMCLTRSHWLGREQE